MAIKSLGLNNLGKSFGLLSEISNPSFKFNCFALDKLTEGAKMHIAAGIDTFKIYIAPDKLAAKSIQEKLSSWGIRVGPLHAVEQPPPIQLEVCWKSTSRL